MQPKKQNTSKDKENFPSVDALYTGIKNADRMTLSRAITLVESKNKMHQKKAAALMDKILPLSGNSMRLALSGAPGVGKSTFIEEFGLYIVEQGLQVAILTIDPSSYRSRGSLLGDKTRMGKLARSGKVYIRPTPAGTELGGVARHTRESILLCEATGYDLVLVETVGVGQSEISAKFLVDIFILMVLPGAGDELQGLKRGIVELADILLVTKADGDNIKAAKEAKRAYRNALQMLGPKESGWKTPTLLSSALNAEGMDDLWETCVKFRDTHQGNQSWVENRKKQIVYGIDQYLSQTLRSWFISQPQLAERFRLLKSRMINRELSFSSFEFQIHQILSDNQNNHNE